MILEWMKVDNKYHFKMDKVTIRFEGASNLEIDTLISEYIRIDEIKLINVNQEKVWCIHCHHGDICVTSESVSLNFSGNPVISDKQEISGSDYEKI